MPICKICGGEFGELAYMKPYTRVCSSVCFTKNFWLEIIEEKGLHQVAGGECFLVGDEDSKSPFRGCAGRRFVLRDLQTSEETVTTNLWCQGKIPEEFRDRLPDTHAFVADSSERTSPLPDLFP